MERGRAFQTTGAHCANALWPSFLDGLHGTDSKGKRVGKLKRNRFFDK